MKIFARYSDTGEITGFKQAKTVQETGFSGNVIEITAEQRDAYFAAPESHGVVGGEWSATWQAPGSAERAEQTRIAGIKRKTADAILVIAPEWKQRNMLARSIELHEIMTTGGTLTTEQQTELDQIRAVWAQIKSIREQSDQAELNGTPAADFNPV